MFQPTFALAALFVAGVSAIEYDAIECGVTNAVTIKGILADQFCTDKALADPSWKLPISGTSLLTAPETHLFACFYGMEVCRTSGYDLLVEGADSTYEIGHRLSEDLNDKMRAFLVDLPAEVKTRAGFVVEITGAVVYDHDDAAAAFGAHCGDDISIVGFDGTEDEDEDSGSGSSSDDDVEDDDVEDDDVCLDSCDAAYSSVTSALPPMIVTLSENTIAADASSCDTAARTECDAKCGACSPTGENIDTDECPSTCIECGPYTLCGPSETRSTCKVACSTEETNDDDVTDDDVTDDAFNTAASVALTAASLFAALW